MAAVLLSSSEAFVFKAIDEHWDALQLTKKLEMILCASKWYQEHTQRSNADQRPGPCEGLGIEDGSNTYAMNVAHVDVKWVMVFTWQAPMMLMAYSVIGFAMGLIIYVCVPLYDGRQFDDEGKVC